MGGRAEFPGLAPNTQRALGTQRVIGRARSARQAVVLFENVAQPPLMLFVNLYGARKQIIGAWIVRFISNPRCLAHLLNQDQQVPVCFFDHGPH